MKRKLKFSMSNNLIFNHIKPAESSKLNKKIFIILSNVNNIPPHIWVSAFGNVFSLDIKGFTANRSIDTVIRSFNKSKTPALFIELKSPTFSHDYVINALSKIVTDLERVKYNSITCLDPVKQYCEMFYDMNTSNTKILSDLIPLLTKNNLIGEIASVNMKTERFELKQYDLNHINERILSLQ